MRPAARRPMHRAQSAAALRSAHSALARSSSVGASRSTVALNRLPCASSLVTVMSPPIIGRAAG